MRNVLTGGTASVACLILAGLWAHSAPTAPNAGAWIKDVLCVRNYTWMIEISCPGTPPCSGSGYRCLYWWNPRGDCIMPTPGAACREDDRYTEVPAQRADCVVDESGQLCVCGSPSPVFGVYRVVDDCL